MEEIEEHIWLCTTQTVLDDGVSADKKKDFPLLLLLLRSSLVCVCVLLVALLLLLLLSVYCIDVYSLVAVHRELSCTYREPCSSPKRRDEKLIYQKEKQLGKCPTLGSSQLENPFFYTILYTPFFPLGWIFSPIFLWPAVALPFSPTFHSQSFGTKVTMHIFFYRMYK
jgi:hypothetical protein